MNSNHQQIRQNDLASAAILVLIVLTSVMLCALYSRTAPHPPLEVAPFAIGPFLGASLAIGAAAFMLVRQDASYAIAIAVLFALTAMVSFGPHKYFDPAFGRIWPAVITAQLATLVIVYWAFTTWRQMRSAE